MEFTFPPLTGADFLPLVVEPEEFGCKKFREKIFLQLK
jgi:hypothetical protein